MSSHRQLSSNEANKSLVQKIVDEAWNHGNFTALDALFEPAVRSVDMDRHRQGVEQMKRAVQLYRTLAPDLLVTIHHMLADGETVVVRWTARGTHTGETQGTTTADILRRADPGFHIRMLTTIRATGHQMSFDGVGIFETDRGKVVSVWLLLDEVEVLRQLGALPTAEH